MDRHRFEYAEFIPIPKSLRLQIEINTKNTLTNPVLELPFEWACRNGWAIKLKGSNIVLYQEET